MTQSSNTDAAVALKTILRLKSLHKSPQIAVTPSPTDTINSSEKSTRSLDIRGISEGEIQAEHVIIHDGACVRGTVVAKTVIIQGFFCGRVKASRIDILDTALVSGELRYDRLAVHPGAQMEAHCVPETRDQQELHQLAV